MLGLESCQIRWYIEIFKEETIVSKKKSNILSLTEMIKKSVYVYTIWSTSVDQM